MLGWGALSELPLSTLDDESVAALAVETLVDNEVRNFVYLVEIYAFQAQDQVGSADIAALSELPLSTIPESAEALETLVTFRFSNRPFITEVDDTPSAELYDPRVIQPLLVERSLPDDGGAMAFTGVAEIVANIVLDNADGGLDTLLTSYTVDGRRVIVRVGDRSATSIDDFEVIYDGAAVGYEHDEETVTLRLRSSLSKIDLPVTTHEYEGSGGVNGGADLKLKPYPLCYGDAQNVTAVPVDATNRIYQVHDGRVNDITAVKERGRALTLTNDYTLDLTNGRFTLAASPAGLITADVQGDKSSGDYVVTAADIARRLLIDRIGYTAMQLDTNAFNQTAADQPATVALFVGAVKTPGRDALNLLLRPHGLFITDDRAGRVTIGRFASGFATDALVLEGKRDILTIERRPAPIDPPAATIQVAYERNWTVQTEDVASALTLAQRQYLAEAERLESAESITAENNHINAQSPEPVHSSFADSADAEDEAGRLIGLHGVDRAIYVIRTPVGLWNTRLNQKCTVTYPRWNLRNGLTGYIVGIREDAQANEQEIRVFMHSSIVTAARSL